VVKSDDTRHARIEAMRHLRFRLRYPGQDERVVHAPDPLILGSSAAMRGAKARLPGARAAG
jgi:polyphosphate kinase